MLLFTIIKMMHFLQEFEFFFNKKFIYITDNRLIETRVIRSGYRAIV